MKKQQIQAKTKISRSVQESVEANQNNKFSPKTFAMAPLTSLLSKWEPLKLGKQDKILNGTNNTKCPKIFLKT